jgi:hypothetical protein
MLIEYIRQTSENHGKLFYRHGEQVVEIDTIA